MLGGSVRSSHADKWDLKSSENNLPSPTLSPRVQISSLSLVFQFHILCFLNIDRLTVKACDFFYFFFILGGFGVGGERLGRKRERESRGGEENVLLLNFLFLFLTLILCSANEYY